jgi:hypothetical protein
LVIIILSKVCKEIFSSSLFGLVITSFKTFN